MKKIYILILTVALGTNLFAQNYEIYFEATGESITLDSVKVENLTQGTSLTLNGDDVLKLVTPVGIGSETHNDLQKLEMFPNPMTTHAYLRISVHNSSNIQLAVNDVSGRSLLGFEVFLNPGLHTFSISGLRSGIYLVQVTDGNISYATKLIVHSRMKERAEIRHISSDLAYLQSHNNNQLKNSTLVIEMPYNEGDRIKFTGMSGNFKTITTLVVTENTTIIFDFMECRDADNNHYAIVAIGSQIWMAENLATIHFNDSTPIPLVTDVDIWSTLTTPAYCWYNNDSLLNRDPYGALYNWFVVDTLSNGNKNICPVGWHVPTSSEWVDLLTYLGGTLSAGGKLKETGTASWYSPNKGASNESGFTARGSGWRNKMGSYNHLKIYGCWWSITQQNETDSRYLEMFYNQSSAFIYSWDKESGFSVRCLKD
ncbi:MAG: T9SS type A sorting domain-containing protein [Bacteroidales bacterium]|nr:T9SS type A sorting domain-containing protein [Bacteroidales bacterium]